MKTKKWMSLVLALVMAFSLAIPAFATATPTLDNTDVTDMAKINTATTTVNGTYQPPILALTVPKKINLLLNPYGVAVTTNKDTAIEQTGVQNQIVSADNLIISRSNVPINIKATATATIASAEGGAWTLAQTAPAADSVKKEAYVYMVFGDVDTTDIDTADEVTDFILTAPANGKKPYEGIAYTDISYPQNPNLTAPAAATDTRDGIVLKAGEGKETTMNQSLDECDVDTDANGAPVYNEVSAVAFKLDGAMVANPKDSAWGKDDKLTVSVAWKFVPGSQAASSGNSQTVTPDITKSTTNYGLTTKGAKNVTIAAADLPTGNDLKTSAPNWTLTSISGITTTSGVTVADSSGSAVITITEAAIDAESPADGGTITINATLGWDKNDSTTGSATVQITITVDNT